MTKIMLKALSMYFCWCLKHFHLFNYINRLQRQALYKAFHPMSDTCTCTLKEIHLHVITGYMRTNDHTIYIVIYPLTTCTSIYMYMCIARQHVTYGF